MNKHKEMSDSEKIMEILDYISKKMPELFKELSGLFYNQKVSKRVGMAVGTFYKQLKNAGMTDEKAFELTCQRVSILDLEDLILSFALNKN
jgi:hypothetical protein